MLKRLAPALVVLLLVGLLAACGGGDDADPTATSAPAPAVTSTPTSAPAAPPTATVSAPATATTAPLPTATQTQAPAPAPTRLIATPTPTPAPPTPTPTPDVGSDPSELIGYAALTVEDLGDGWELIGIDVPELTADDSTAICGLPRFADRAQREAALQLDFEHDGLPAALTQDLHIFPYSVAIDAMTYAREIAGACTEWTDEDGTVFQLSPLEDPLLGDESFALLLSFNTPDGVAIEAHLSFVRIDEYLMSLTYVTLAGGDTTPLLGIMQTATAKMFAMSEHFFFDHYDPALLAQSGALLLTTPELPEGWQLTEYAIPYGDERYGVCDALPFPDEFGASSELAARFHIDIDNGPFMAHTLVVFDDESVATDAMSFIRDNASCDSWVDSSDLEYVVLGRTTLDMGDESAAVLVQGEDEEFGSVQIGFLFVRTGSVITAMLVAALGEIDQQSFEQILQTALAKLGR